MLLSMLWPAISCLKPQGLVLIFPVDITANLLSFVLPVLCMLLQNPGKHSATTFITINANRVIRLGKDSSKYKLN